VGTAADTAANYTTSGEAPTVNGRERAIGRLVLRQRASRLNSAQWTRKGQTVQVSTPMPVRAKLRASLGWETNNSRARPSSGGSAFSCCYSPESATR